MSKKKKEYNVVEIPKLTVDYGNEPYAKRPDGMYIAPKKSSPAKLLLIIAVLAALLFAGYRYLQNKSSEQVPPPTVLEKLPDEVTAVQERPEIAYLRGENRYKFLFKKYEKEWTCPELDAPDSVHMKNGKMFIGKVTSVSETVVTIKTLNDTINCPIEDMKYFFQDKVFAAGICRLHGPPNAGT